MTDKAVKGKYGVHCTNTSRHVHLLNTQNVTLSLNSPLSLRMERFVSGTEQLCPRYRHKSVSGSRVGHKSLSFVLLDKSQLDIWVTFSQPTYDHNPSVNLHFHIQTCILKEGESNIIIPSEMNRDM